MTAASAFGARLVVWALGLVGAVLIFAVSGGFIVGLILVALAVFGDRAIDRARKQHRDEQRAPLTQPAQQHRAAPPTATER